ncbi:MAG: hypothetical protein WBN45_13475 [Arenicellales bacterium]
MSILKKSGFFVLAATLVFIGSEVGSQSVAPGFDSLVPQKQSGTDHDCFSVF